jgi:hypothetical protein
VSECEKIVVQLLNTTEKVWIANILGIRLGPNTCERWVLAFESKLPHSFSVFENKCIQKAMAHTWDIPGGYLSTRHAAYRVEFCDGTVVFLDQGALGKGDHIFWPADVPSEWK